MLVQTGWANAQELLDVEADFKGIKPTFAMEALRERVDAFVFMVNQREQQALNMTLDAALDQGWTPGELADRIQQTFAEGYHVLGADDSGQVVVKRVMPTAYWSETVARTELNRAQTLGALQLYDAAGIEKVKWQTNHGSTVRDICQDFDGEVYAIPDAPECPAHPRCCCALTPADDDVKFTQADADASAEFMQSINEQNDAALRRYNDSKT